jgi:hypothetical protein
VAYDGFPGLTINRSSSRIGKERLMQRDMDLIRALILKLEALPMRPGGTAHITAADKEVAVSGKTVDEIDYHLSQIEKSGYIDTGGVTPMVGIGFRCLTKAGHDFADSVRDDAIWHEAKEGAKKAGGFSIELLVSLAKGLLKKKIEQHTGVEIDL